MPEQTTADPAAAPAISDEEMDEVILRILGPESLEVAAFNSAL